MASNLGDYWEILGPALEQLPYQQMRYVLDTIPEFPFSESQAGMVRLSSFPTAGYQPIIAREGHRVSFGQVQPLAWTATHGVLTVVLSHDHNHVRRNLRLGMVMRFAVWFGPAHPENFYPVFVGRVKSYTRQGGRYTIELSELPSVLTSRLITQTVAQDESLFHDLASTVVSPGAYVAGYASIDVADASGFRADTGGTHIIKVFSETGTWFGEATKSGNTFTWTGHGAGAFGTTEEPAGVGRAVQEVAYISGHPADVVAKILTSTGTGLNGTYDTLPASWGYGIPAKWLNVQSILDTKVLLAPSGAAVWDVHSDVPQGNGLAWLQSWLAPAGLWLCMRHGALSVAAVRKPPMRGFTDLLTITEDDIVSIDRHEFFASSWPGEYTAIKVHEGDGVTFTRQGELNQHLPKLNEKSIHNPFIFTDTVQWRNDLADRLQPWHTRTPELIELTLLGWRFGEIAMGDTFALESMSRAIVRRDGRPYLGQNVGLLLCLSCQPDWFGATTRIVGLNIPEDSTQWY